MKSLMFAALFLLAPAAFAADAPATQPVADAATTQPAADAAPVNKFCPVESDDPIDPAVTYVYKGQTIAFCCEDCIKDFKKNPDKYLAKMK
jgi:YHS domain-containing protein